MLRACAVVLLVGCGSVKTTTDGGTDAPACIDPTSVDSCGATCEPCEAPSDRATATCDGVACGFACNGGAPSCSDSTCSRNGWTFGSGTIEGITAMPLSLPLAVRDHAGNPALAIEVTELAAGISIRVPVCLSGTVDLTAATFRVTVFFEGGEATGEQYYLQASAPDPATGQIVIGQTGIQAGMYKTLAGSFGGATGAAVTHVTVQLGSFGAAFAGTIWVDDIAIE